VLAAILENIYALMYATEYLKTSHTFLQKASVCYLKSLKKYSREIQTEQLKYFVEGFKYASDL